MLLLRKLLCLVLLVTAGVGATAVPAQAGAGPLTVSLTTTPQYAQLGEVVQVRATANRQGATVSGFTLQWWMDGQLWRTSILAGTATSSSFSLTLASPHSFKAVFIDRSTGETASSDVVNLPLPLPTDPQTITLASEPAAENHPGQSWSPGPISSTSGVVPTVSFPQGSSGCSPVGMGTASPSFNFLGTGTCKVNFHVPAANGYAAADLSRSFEITKWPTTTTLEPVPSPLVPGVPVTLKAKVATSGERVPTGMTRLRLGQSLGGFVPVGPDGTAQITVTPTTAGSYDAVAEYFGSNGEEASTSTAQTVAVGKPVKLWTDLEFRTVQEGDEFQFFIRNEERVPGTVQIRADNADVGAPYDLPLDGTTHYFTLSPGAHQLSVVFTPAAGTGYTAVTQDLGNVEVTSPPKPQTLQVPGDLNKRMTAGQTQTVTVASGGSSEPVVLATTTPAICSVSGQVVTALKRGSCRLSADQAGDSSYLAAPQLLLPAIDVKPAPVTATLRVPQADSLRAGQQFTFHVDMQGMGAPAARIGVLSAYWDIPTKGYVDALFDSRVVTGDGTYSFDFNPDAGQGHNLVVEFVADDGARWTTTSDFKVLDVAGAPLTLQTGTLPPTMYVDQATYLTASVVEDDRPVQITAGPSDVCSVVPEGDARRLEFQKIGDCDVTYHAKGDATYESVSKTDHVTAIRYPSATVLAPMDPDARVGAPVLLKAFVQAAGPGAVQFVIDGDDFGSPVRVVTPGPSFAGGPRTPRPSASASTTFTPRHPATHEVTARFVPDAPTVLEPSTSVPADLVVGKGQQVITHAVKPTDARPGDSWDPQALGGASGNPVKVNVVSEGVCTLTSAGSVRFDATGICELQLTQAGDDDWQAADPVPVSFTVDVIATTLALAKAPDARVGVEQTLLALLSAPGAGGTVQLFDGDRRVGDPVPMVLGAAMLRWTPARAGTAHLRAEFTPHDQAYGGSSATQDVEVTKTRPTLTLTNPRTTGDVGERWTPQLSSLSDGAISVTLDPKAPAGVCSVDQAGTVSFDGPGTCELSVHQAATEAFDDAGTSTTVEVLGFPKLSAPATLDGVMTVGRSQTVTVAGGGSSAPVVLSSSTPQVCSVEATRVTALRSGSCILAANQAGDAHHYAAPQLLMPIVVSAAPVTLVLAVPDFDSARFGKAIDASANLEGLGQGSAAIVGTLTATWNGVEVWSKDVTGDGRYPFQVTPTRAGPAQALRLKFTPADTGLWQPSSRVGAIDVAKAPLTLTTGDLPSSMFVDERHDLTASVVEDDRVVSIEAAPAEVCAVETRGALRQLTFAKAGVCTVTYSAVGDANHEQAVKNVDVSGTRHDTVTTVLPVAGVPRVGEWSEIKATVTPFRAGAVQFAVDGIDVLAPVRLTQRAPSFVPAPGEASLSVIPPHAGDHTLTARFIPDDAVVDAPSTSAGQPVTVAKGQQKITHADAPTGVHVGDTWDPRVTGGASGKAVTVTSTSPDVCSVTRGRVRFDAVGTCAVELAQAGDQDWADASPVPFAIPVAVIPTTVTLAPGSNPTVGARRNVLAILDRAAAGSVQLFNGDDAVGDPAPVLAGMGSLWWTPAHAGTAHLRVVFTPAQPLVDAGAVDAKDVTVAKAPQGITLAPSSPSAKRVGESWQPQVTGGASGVPVQVAVDDASASVCQLDQGVVRFLAEGSCLVQFSQAGTDDYLAAAPVARTVTVSRVTTAVTLTVPQQGLQVDRPQTVSATTPAGVPGAVVFTWEGKRSAEVPVVQRKAELELAFPHAGARELKAEFLPTDQVTYAPSSTTATLDVAPGDQRIQVANDPTTAYVGHPWTPVTSGGDSGEPVTMSVSGLSDDGACAVREESVQMLKAGSCAIVFDQAGTEDYTAAPSRTTTFEVVRNATTIELGPVTGWRVGQPATVEVTTTGALDGTATFMIGDAKIGRVQVTDGHGSLTWTPPFVFTEVLEVTFSPTDEVTWEETGDYAEVTVGKGTQAITLGSSAPTQAHLGGTWQPVATGGASGQDVVVTASPERVCGYAAGTVRFTGLGTCTVTFDQAGDENWEAAERRTAEVAVVTIPTSTTVTGASGVVGQPLDLAATVRPAHLDGTVSFSVGGERVGDPVPVADGVAAASVTREHAGSARVTAVFTPGDATYAGSSDVDDLAVGRASTGTSVVLTARQVRATVTTLAPGGGVPTGDVVFFVGDRRVGTATLADGVATIDRDPSTGGDVAVRAVYAGGDDRVGSEGTTASSHPSITAHLTAEQGSTRGWYSAPVTVTFTCDPDTSELDGACPQPVVLDQDGRGQSVTRTITTLDGATATTTMDGIDIDRTGPSVKVAGIRDGRTYYGSAPKPRCQGRDDLSGLARCSVSVDQVGLHRFEVVATAVDRAGNVSRASKTYGVRTFAWIGDSTLDGSTFVVTGDTVQVVALTRRSQPELLGPTRAPGDPRGHGPEFSRAGRRDGKLVWVATLRVGRDIERGRTYVVGIRVPGNTGVRTFRVE